MSSKKKNVKKRAQRATSNVFAMFDQNQIQEFKEAFYMIDQDRDGFITREDLNDMFASLGKVYPDEYVDEMLSEASGPINFTMFLTLFGCKLVGTDPDDVIRNAFSCFDEQGTGFVSEEVLKDLLMSIGDRYTNKEADELLSEMPNKNGFIDYVEFCRVLKNGKNEPQAN